MPIDLTPARIQKLLDQVRKDHTRREVRDSRARGLTLVAGARGAVWYVSLERDGRQHRIRLGDLETWSLDEARALAGEAGALVRDRRGWPDDAWLTGRLEAAGKIVGQAPAQAIDLRWTFDEARRRYLEHVKDTRREATHRDYAGKLRTPELVALAPRRVAELRLLDMARAVEAVAARGAQAQAEGVVRVIKAMWSWLEDPIRIEASGIAPGVMQRLRAPERKLREDDGEKGLHVPAPDEIGTILAVARSGALDSAVAGAFQLLVYTAQRRRTVVEARPVHFEARSDDEGLWIIPPARRKTGRTRPQPHVIPLPASAWRVVRSAPDGRSWLFPGRLAAADTHLHTDSLTHALARLGPLGVESSPHDLRRAFGTHGEKILGIPRQLTKAILDHGAESGDVTATHYSLHDRSHLTWPVMDRWVTWCDEQAAAALEREPRLADADWIRARLAQ